MISYKQGDTRWGDQRIGTSALTLKRAGCLITAIADLSTYFGDMFDPSIVNARCKFTPDGRVWWSSVKFPSFEYTYREYGRNDAGIWRALLDPDSAVVLEVNHGQHWVVATGWDYFRHIFKIADPFFGDRSNLKRYDNNITGAAYFRRVRNG